MEGFDSRGVIVGLHLEHDGKAVADVDGACVLFARGQEDPGSGGREVLEEGAGVLVGAVLTPEGTEHAEFHGGGLTTEAADDEVVFRLFEGDLVE